MICRRAVLTGATGFLGLHLLPALRAAGFDVRILARRDIAHPAWDGLEFETVRGSLQDKDALAELVQGADVVVHAAGLIKANRRAEFIRVNRDGTAALAAITRTQAPTARFLYVSSLAAREPQLSDYAFSKRQAEEAAEAAFATVREQLAIIRPPAIYGPWDRETLTLFRSTLQRFAAVPGQSRSAVIHATDAACAITALAKTWRYGRFTLADMRPEGYKLRELLQAVARATGGKPYLLRPPDELVLAVAYCAWAWARLTGKPQIFGPGKAREMLYPDWSVRPGELLPAEIYAPRFSLEKGLADTVAWYRKSGWLK